MADNKDTLVTEIHQQLGCTEDQTTPFIREVLEDIQLFDRKQRDYGPQNIAAFGEVGVLVRANDKIARLINLIWTRGLDATGTKITPANESLEDSWRDLSVYGVIARLCRKELWES